MSHIVVLSSIYLGKASTNGLCARNIVDALSKEGHDIDVVCYEDSEMKHEKNVFAIHNSLPANNGRARKFASKLTKVLYLLVSNPKSFLVEEKIDRYYGALCEIDKKHKIDAVVAMLFPMETAEAATRFKKTHSNTKTIIFELDSISDGVAQTDAIQKLLNYNYLKWLRSFYKVVDNVIVMKSHSEYWLNTFGKESSYKLKVSDIPVLLPKAKKSDDYSEVSFIYAGLIEKKYRSPEYLLRVLKEISKKLYFTFRFFSKGDCENMIAETASTVPGIYQNGYVTQAELDKAIDSTTFLVSIGNSTSNSVPSKLISYISYQKPIIHFSSQKNDVCKAYLNEYPLSLVIDQDQPVEESANQILNFIDNLKSGKLSDVSIIDLYEMNKPTYSAKLISSIVNQA